MPLSGEICARRMPFSAANGEETRSRILSSVKRAIHAYVQRKTHQIEHIFLFASRKSHVKRKSRQTGLFAINGGSA